MEDGLPNICSHATFEDIESDNLLNCTYVDPLLVHFDYCLLGGACELQSSQRALHLRYCSIDNTTNDELISRGQVGVH